MHNFSISRRYSRNSRTSVVNNYTETVSVKSSTFGVLCFGVLVDFIHELGIGIDTVIIFDSIVVKNKDNSQM